MEAIRWSIYTLENPLDNTIFYVGKTTDTKTRFLSHMKGNGSKDKYYLSIIELITKEGHLPVMRIVEQTFSRPESSKLERKWIKHFKSIYPLLCNKQLCKDFREYRPGYKGKNNDRSYFNFPAEKSLYIQLSRGKEMIENISKLSGSPKSKVVSAILSNYYSFPIYAAVKKHLNIK